MNVLGATAKLSFDSLAHLNVKEMKEMVAAWRQEDEGFWDNRSREDDQSGDSDFKGLSTASAECGHQTQMKHMRP